MIDIDKVEGRCKSAMQNGYGHLPVMECGNAVKISELIGLLRQSEKDAERYRWLRDIGRHECGTYDFFDGSSCNVDCAIDEAMQCSK